MIKIQMFSKILGIFLLFFSISMIIPITISIYYQEKNVFIFIKSFFFIFFSGLFLYMIGFYTKQELKNCDGFLVVFLIWIFLGISGSLPFLFLKNSNFDFSKSLFESISGLTTTGSTIITNFKNLPKSLLYYRQQLQFFGGIGIVVLAIAIIPIMEDEINLYKIENTDPMKNNQFYLKFYEKAKELWKIYLLLNFFCIIAYWAICKMNFFDAVSFAFSTISTGGFSPYDQGINHYTSFTTHIISIIFMLLGSINFSLHYFFLKKKR